MPRWPSLAKSLEQRLMEKVARQANDCWQWTGNHHQYGYGLLKIDGKQIRAHRISWELKNGAIPAGLHILHRCDTPSCVNPDHLFLGTQADNIADKLAKGRQARGERLHSSKLKVVQVIEIKRLLAAGAKNRTLARQFDVTPTAIRAIAAGRAWKHIPSKEVANERS